MTQTEIDKLTPEQKRERIATLCGWTNLHFDERAETLLGDGGNWGPEWGGIPKRVVPEYTLKLDAMHGAERELLKDMNARWYPYCRLLHAVTNGVGEHANVTQRVNSFLLVMG